VARAARKWLIGPLAIAAVATIAASTAGADPVPGSQGTDTSLPATDSQLTVRGRGTFADLAITINQTRNLTNQAVSVSWTGGVPTRGPGRFGANYLQIMQCWGDDDGTVAGNPGPKPEQCVQGAVGGVYGGNSGADTGAYPKGNAYTRVISRSTWANYDPTVGFLDDGGVNVWRPFQAVGGTTVNGHINNDFNPSESGGHYWLNPYFDVVTTNEVIGAVTGNDGRGSELFQVLTGVQSSGLGCGQKVEPVAGSAEKKIPKCWIVIVPRGTPLEENVGTPSEGVDQDGVVTSPLSPAAWQNRIAIPIEFNPVDSPCSLADEERRISGNELALPAVASWQPLLCTTGDLPPYSYASVGDPTARQQLASATAGAPGMVVVSRPFPATAFAATNPVFYAPLSVSGIVIGFNIERVADLEAPAAEQALAGVRVAELNLTPRLVAKLLTQSYVQQVGIQGVPPASYTWATGNPQNLSLDPDFLQFNPEFDLLQVQQGRTFSGLSIPAGNSDAAHQVWEWVLADPEARAWLEGTADPWGMRVNPVFAATASANPLGVAFGTPVPTSFPKSDPYCYQAASRTAPGGGEVKPPLLCGTDWNPYSRGFADAAQVARTAFDGARIVDNPNALAASDVWKRGVPQPLGSRAMLTLTDTPSASVLGVQMARLSRAGDDGPNREFIEPDVAGLTAGVKAMQPGAEPQVLEPAPAATSPGAYPLTAISYAAIAPLALDAKARAEYAAFIDYAADPGQVSGLQLGQLPQGYAPLPLSMRFQALIAAEIVRNLVLAPTPTTTTSTTTTTTTTSTTLATTASSSSTGNSATTPRSTTTPAATQTASATTTVPPTSTESANTTLPPTDTESATTTVPPTTTAVPKKTPGLSLGRNRLAVPGIGILALGSALGALEITKRPRRGLASEALDSAEADGED
jgi:hypothetical protein